MLNKKISQEFRFKNTDETKNYLIEEIKRNDLMIKKLQKVYAVLNYIEHLLILVSSITFCVSIFAFALLVGIPIDITSSTISQ